MPALISTIVTNKANTMRCCNGQTAIVTSIVLSGILLGWTTAAAAQRRPIADDTLGNEGSRVVPLDPQADPPPAATQGDRIEGGARRGDNLFHSFREFHVDEGRGVYFADPGVDNILARVTGGVESQILGVLGVLGNANLFLINPSGIIFGNNARLDVRGSFVATTADAIGFAEQGFFSATDPTAPPLLTVQPSAALFNQLNPAAIANRSTALAEATLSEGLRVPAGERLTLLGGNISINGSGLTASGGRVEVGGLSQPGTVTLNPDGSLGFPIGVRRSDVSLTNGAFIDVVAGGGGSIAVNAGELEILNSFLSAGIGSNSGSTGAQAGDITINASTIRGGESASISNLVGSGGIGNGGDIRITTGSLSLTNGAELQAITYGQGNAGNVVINARDRVLLAGAIGASPANPDIGSSILSAVGDSSDRTAVGNGGDIRITTGSLSLTNGAQLIAGTAAQGNAGNIIINARDRFFLSNGAYLTTSTFGQGNGGNVIINARDQVVVDNAPIFSTVGSYLEDVVAVGNGGDIRITTGSLSLRNGAELQAVTFKQGNAGNVIVRARDRVLMDGVNQEGFLSGIFTATVPGAQGRGGNVRIAADTVRLANRARVSTETLNRFPGGSVTINVNTLEVAEGGQVVTSTSDRGAAGNIILNAADRIILSGVFLNYDNLEDPTGGGMISDQGAASGLYASTARNASGQGGTVQITTGQLQVFDQARIVVDSQGSGTAGDINLAAETVQLDDQARLTAETAAVDGGNITLRDVERLQLSNNSLISTTAGTDPPKAAAWNDRSGGDGGNVDIDANLILSLPNNNSDIRANAFSGSGGNVRITTEGLFGIAAQPQDNPLTSDITASSQQGVQGTVDVTTPDIDPRRGLVELPVEVVDASNQMAQTCADARAGGNTSEFAVTGRGGLPSSPIDPLVGDESLADWSTLNESETAVASQLGEGTIAPPTQSDVSAAGAIRSWRLREAIVEAQGWLVGEDGAVRLIAAAPASAVQPPEVCHRSQDR